MKITTLDPVIAIDDEISNHNRSMAKNEATSDEILEFFGF